MKITTVKALDTACVTDKMSVETTNFEQTDSSVHFNDPAGRQIH